MKAVVTGQARGLGAAIAEDLLSRDIAVLGISRKRNAALEKKFPGRLEQVELDLSDTAATLDWLAGAALQQFVSGSATVLLINNAGTVQPVGPLMTQDLAAISRAVTLNVTAPMMLASAVATVSTMATVSGATDKRILHVSSGAGRNAVAGWSVYGATKAALDHHARNVFADQIPGLRICSLAPGVIDTDMQTEIRSTGVDRFPSRERFEALKRDGGLSTPADCARKLVDYLLSAQFGRTPLADLREVTV